MRDACLNQSQRHWQKSFFNIFISFPVFFVSFNVFFKFRLKTNILRSFASDVSGALNQAMVTPVTRPRKFSLQIVPFFVQSRKVNIGFWLFTPSKSWPEIKLDLLDYLKGGGGIKWSFSQLAAKGSTNAWPVHLWWVHLGLWYMNGSHALFPGGWRRNQEEKASKSMFSRLKVVDILMCFIILAVVYSYIILNILLGIL